MNENLTKLDFKPEIQIADTIDSLVYFLKHAKGDYRIIIDENSGLNIIMPMDIIHVDGLYYAVTEGWYSDYIKSDSWSDTDDYFGKMLVWDKLHLLLFSATDGEYKLGEDDIEYSNKYDFGWIYTKREDNKIPECLTKIIGKPLEVKKSMQEDWMDDINFDDIDFDLDYSDIDLSIPEPEPEVKVDYTEHWVVLDKSVINDNFAKWWGNSYCCNSKGEPIVVYHSTNAEFDTFKSLDGSANGRPVYGGGFCFSAYEDYTKDFGKNTMPCVLSIQKPLNLQNGTKLSLMTTYQLLFKDDWEERYNDPEDIQRGYLLEKIESVTSCFQLLNNEGYSFKEIMDAYGYDGIIDGHIFVVVNPNQIKSINNKGTWSKTSDNIYESLNRRLERYL